MCVSNLLCGGVSLDFKAIMRGAGGSSLDSARGALLDNMRQFVSQEAHPGTCIWCELTAA
jgi:hypothetical protein